MTDTDIRARYGPITDTEILLVRAVRGNALEEAIKAASLCIDAFEYDRNCIIRDIRQLKEPANG